MVGAVGNGVTRVRADCAVVFRPIYEGIAAVGRGCYGDGGAFRVCSGNLAVRGCFNAGAAARSGICPGGDGEQVVNLLVSRIFIVPVIPFRNLTPLIPRADIIDILQTAALKERGFPDARHAVRDRHALKGAALIERFLPDARHAVRDCHALKALAAIERGLPDARHARRDRHARKAAAVIERSGFDARHTEWDRHIRECAVLESISSDARHAGRDRHAREAGATERVLPDVRQF